MSLIRNKLFSMMRAFEEKKYARRCRTYDKELSFSQAAQKYPNPNEFYHYLNHYFHHLCPESIKAHRKYFKQEQRGFGEDAFHAMWWLLLREYKPKRMLEIGVYRGQTISLWSMICKELKQAVEIHGISPFSPLGDSVSSYLRDLDYKQDILDSFAYWKLEQPLLLKALSTDPQAVEYIESNSWDMIYIDGCHDFDVAFEDYKLCRESLSPGGILILDDASLYTDFKALSFAFCGHPGPSKIAREYADNEMELLAIAGHNNIYMKT